MNTDKNRRAPAKKGFTLLELIVVITIIGLLGTLVVTKVAPLLTRGNATKVKYDLQKIFESASMFFSEENRYPDSIDELVNAQNDAGEDIMGSLEKTPKDPWGNEYGYELRDGKPLVVCLGRDGNTGGDGDDKDYEYPESEEY